ncbi:MAG: hypothetical protein RLZZ337_773 [Bacteroidota bacterium]|jgi:hypothetical protein
MKYVIRAILVIAICVLGYYTFKGIAEPVRYAKEVEIKEQKVIDKLKIIRDAQILYKDQTGSFTASFDTLCDFMQNGKIKVMVEFGDKDDSTTVYKIVPMELNVRDTLFKNVDIENLRFVPYYDTLQFVMQANTIVKNNVKVPVFQVTDPKPFNREREKKNDPLRVGSVYEVDYNGNWGSR